MQLRCNQCSQNKNGFCKLLKELLPHGYAKLDLGGIVNDPKHIGRCGYMGNNKLNRGDKT
jgi:hypothetical protein